MKGRRPCGVSLGGTVLAISVLAVVAFSLSSLVITHLRMSSRQRGAEQASNAARSAISAAISKIMESPEFGQSRSAEQEIRLQMPDAVGLLTFNEADAREESMPYSTNNLDGREDVPGAEGALVPASTVYLTAVGRSNGVERYVDAVLRVPPFPWAIASGGRIETRNGVLVASLPEGVWPPPTDESLMLPADLVANGSGSQAITLGDGSRILGDVETVGAVYISSPDKVVVKGEVRNGSAPVEIPTLNPDDFDPAGNGTDHFTLNDGNVGEISGTARASRSLDFAGPLKLDNAQLFVDGDLTLRGGVRGAGAIIATGDVRVIGGAQVETPTELAIISGGKVQLAGTGAERSRIRGIFYAEDGLEASEMTLVGSLLTGNASTGIALDRVNILHEEPRFDLVQEQGPSGNDTAYLGKYEPGRPASMDLSTLTRTRPGYQYGFSMKVEQVTPGVRRPIRITVGPGFVTSTTRSWTIQHDRDIAGIQDWLYSEYQRSTVPRAPLPGPHRQLFANVTAPLVDDLDNGNITPGGGGAGGSGLGSLLEERFSEFFPVEDRIRMISWIER